MAAQPSALDAYRALVQQRMAGTGIAPPPAPAALGGKSPSVDMGAMWADMSKAAPTAPTTAAPAVPAPAPAPELDMGAMWADIQKGAPAEPVSAKPDNYEITLRDARKAFVAGTRSTFAAPIFTFAAKVGRDLGIDMPTVQGIADQLVLQANIDTQGMSKAGQRALSKGSLLDPGAVGLKVMLNLPSLFTTVIPTLGVANAAVRIAKAKGVVDKTILAAKAAKAAGITSSAAEGVQGVGAAEQEIRNFFDSADDADIRKAAKAAGLKGTDTDKLREELKTTVAAKIAPYVSGAADAVLGYYGGKAVGHIVGEEVGGRLLRGAKGALVEGVGQEGPQGVAESIANQYGEKHSVDLGQAWREGVESAEIGGVMGGGAVAVMGGGKKKAPAPVPAPSPAVDPALAAGVANADTTRQTTQQAATVDAAVADAIRLGQSVEDQKSKGALPASALNVPGATGGTGTVTATVSAPAPADYSGQLTALTNRLDMLGRSLAEEEAKPKPTPEIIGNLKRAILHVKAEYDRVNRAHTYNKQPGTAAGTTPVPAPAAGPTPTPAAGPAAVPAPEQQAPKAVFLPQGQLLAPEQIPKGSKSVKLKDASGATGTLIALDPAHADWARTMVGNGASIADVMQVLAPGTYQAPAPATAPAAPAPAPATAAPAAPAAAPAPTATPAATEAPAATGAIPAAALATPETPAAPAAPAPVITSEQRQNVGSHISTLLGTKAAREPVRTALGAAVQALIDSKTITETDTVTLPSGEVAGLQAGLGKLRDSLKQKFTRGKANTLGDTFMRFADKLEAAAPGTNALMQDAVKQGTPEALVRALSIATNAVNESSTVEQATSKYDASPPVKAVATAHNPMEAVQQALEAFTEQDMPDSKATHIPLKVIAGRKSGRLNNLGSLAKTIVDAATQLEKLGLISDAQYTAAVTAAAKYTGWATLTNETIDKSYNKRYSRKSSDQAKTELTTAAELLTKTVTPEQYAAAMRALPKETKAAPKARKAKAVSKAKATPKEVTTSAAEAPKAIATVVPTPTPAPAPEAAAVPEPTPEPAPAPAPEPETGGARIRKKLGLTPTAKAARAARVEPTISEATPVEEALPEPVMALEIPDGNLRRSAESFARETGIEFVSAREKAAGKKGLTASEALESVLPGITTLRKALGMWEKFRSVGADATPAVRASEAKRATPQQLTAFNNLVEASTAFLRVKKGGLDAARANMRGLMDAFPGGAIPKEAQNEWMQLWGGIRDVFRKSRTQELLRQREAAAQSTGTSEIGEGDVGSVTDTVATSQIDQAIANIEKELAGLVTKARGGKLSEADQAQYLSLSERYDDAIAERDRALGVESGLDFSTPYDIDPNSEEAATQMWGAPNASLSSGLELVNRTMANRGEQFRNWMIVQAATMQGGLRAHDVLNWMKQNLPTAHPFQPLLGALLKLNISTPIMTAGAIINKQNPDFRIAGTYSDPMMADVTEGSTRYIGATGLTVLRDPNYEMPGLQLPIAPINTHNSYPAIAHPGVVIISRATNPRSIVSTTLHEIIHAVTMQHIGLDPVFTKAVNDLFILANNAMVSRYDKTAAQNTYGLSHPAEMVAEGFSNPWFQKFLLSVEVPPKLRSQYRAVNLWNAFLVAIKRTLGAGNVSNTVMDELTNLIGTLDTFSSATALASTVESFRAVRALTAELSPFAKSWVRDQQGILHQSRFDELWARQMGVMVNPSTVPARFTQALADSREATVFRADMERTVWAAPMQRTGPANVPRTMALSSKLPSKQDIKDFWTQFGTSETLAWMTLDQIERYGKKYFDVLPAGNSLSSFMSVIRRKTVRARRMQKQADTLMRDLLGFVGDPQAENLAKLRHDSTLAEIDPSVPLTAIENAHLPATTAIATRYAALKAIYDGLGAVGKSLYTREKEHYANIRKSIRKASLALLFQSRGIPNADLLADAMLNMTSPAARGATVAALPQLSLKKQAELTKSIESTLHETAVKGPYFPLRRRGNWVVDVQKELETKSFNSDAERQAYKDQRLTQDPTLRFKDGAGHSVTVIDRIVEMNTALWRATRRLKELNRQGYAGVDGRHVAPSRKIETNILNTKDMSLLLSRLGTKADTDPSPQGKGKHNAITAALQQAYIEMLADNSIRKSELTRAKVKGAATSYKDAVQTFAERAYAGSWAVADLTTAFDEQQAMRAMMREQKQAITVDAPTVGTITSELTRRQENQQRDRAFGGIESKVVRWGFVNYLASLSYSIINATQTFTFGLPHVAARFGEAKALAHFGSAIGKYSLPAMRRAARGWGGLRVGQQNLDDFMDTLLLNPKIAPQEKAMMHELLDQGIIDATFVMELARTAQGKLGKGWIDYIEEGVRFMPQMVEIMNRVIVASAAYNAARVTMTHADAVSEASEAVLRTQLDYSAVNRPRRMQWKGARTIMMFKMYAQGVYAYIAENMLKLAGPNRTEGMKALSYMTGMHTLLGGALGGLLWEPARFLIYAVGMALGDKRPEWMRDVDTTIRNAVAEQVGQKWGEVVSRGLPRLAGVDMSKRIGLSNILTPGGYEAKTWEDKIQNSLVQLGGPMVGLAMRYGRGVDYINRGQYLQAISMFMPKAMGDAWSAHAMAQQGVLDSRGVPILEPDKLSAHDYITQVVGFAPAVLAEVREQKQAEYGYDQAMYNRKTLLQQRWQNADFDKRNQIFIDEILPFNLEHYDYRIKLGELYQTAADRRKEAQRAGMGVFVDKKRRSAIEAGRFANVE